MCYFSFLWWRAPVGIPVITLFAVLCFSVLVIGIQSLGPNLSHLPVFKSTRTVVPGGIPAVNVSILDPIPNTIITVHKIEQF